MRDDRFASLRLLLLPIGVLSNQICCSRTLPIGAPHREATSTSSAVARILVWAPSRPYAPSHLPGERPHLFVRLCATLSRHIPNTMRVLGLEAWPATPRGAMSYPRAQWHPIWRCPGKAAASNLLFLGHVGSRAVSRPGGCGAPQAFKTIFAKPTISAIDQSGASACANQQATAM